MIKVSHDKYDSSNGKLSIHVTLKNRSDRDVYSTSLRIIFNDNKNIQCKLIRNKHKGPGAARNECIKHATGNWISFLDSDDLWEKNKLEVVVGVINKNKSKNFIFHNEAKIKLNGDKI